ncbi:marine proteobacterial sortase target protein [Shewanella sp. GD03713]|uniref:marine proteobacterial sortase target protein n=1 Tax=Shewanella sp. GD03713 TaxID=2975372 RepID=UPI000B3464DD|nr:marine proteobacterial sortase target protein [Shewanella sp. GD03713]MDH1470700.1 marine proteobacterial sortase target protein [Shewanella sp. GD03713]QXN26635.1 marine proteobacterial sortase target protein [Shewanella putrefaciens]
MITGKRVKEVCQTLAMLVIGASICWGLPFAVLASPNSVGTLSAPQNIAATFDEHTASTLPAFSFDDVTQGMLVYQTASGRLMPSLPVDTQVSMQVSGLTNRVSVKQVFSNQTGFVLNGRYLFPLPNEAAVDSLRLHIGERIIEGQIHPKQQAKQIFEQAKAEGKRASLVSQERPNMFTTEVTNLAPDEELVVEISYQETIHYEDGLFSLRFPLVVAPRYIPGLTLGGNNGERVTSSQVFDADRIIAPIRDADSEADPVLKADIKVKLGEGVDKSAVVSPYHPITIDEKQGQLTAAVANRVPANRDFVLQWRLKQGSSPVAWVFNQAGKTHVSQDDNASADSGSTASINDSSNTDNYSLVMVLPPKVEASEQLNLPRELILVIDTSGSMAGDSIIQAKNALRYALRGLRPQDSFNIIEFNSDVSLLSPTLLPATATNLAMARQFVNRLQADGGTEMAQALNAALPRQAFNTASGEDKSLRQVIFMTDGSVGNESALFELIRNQIGDNRLFTVGIGSAPNSHFMQRAAELGRGTFTYIGDVDEVEQKISQLLAKIQYPVLTDLQVRFDDGSVPDYWPSPIPDLYRGEPVLISLKRHPREPQELVISGRQGHKNWQQSLSLQANVATDVAQSSAGLDLLWARKQIAALELSKNGANDDKVKQQVTALSLNYHLVSPYTSLVAVDLTPITSNAMSRDAVVRQHLPLGWQPMGVLPQTSTSSRFDMLLGGSVLLLALMLALSIRRQQRQQRALSLALNG